MPLPLFSKPGLLPGLEKSGGGSDFAMCLSPCFFSTSFLPSSELWQAPDTLGGLRQLSGS